MTFVDDPDTMCGYVYLAWTQAGQVHINPSPADLFCSIFHSFKAGIANAISSFK